MEKQLCLILCTIEMLENVESAISIRLNFHVQIRQPIKNADNLKADLQRE